ncbi:FAD-binding oxidoreductase, partial [bacterium]|nr:FAD-binding oxidoreductase [bacterium]
MTKPQKLASWGNYPVREVSVHTVQTVDEIRRVLNEAGPVIARGLGRSYGDSSLGRHVVSMTEMNRILAFDESAGILTAEAGLSIADALRVIVPKGWFFSVTPGTKFVTLGGAIASDIHGKNHHVEGSFCRYVTQFTILLPSGEVQSCTPQSDPSFFEATCGGMGLTGVILSASIRLKKIETAYIIQQTMRVSNLKEMMDAFETTHDTTYSVAWIDCL